LTVFTLPSDLCTRVWGEGGGGRVLQRLFPVLLVHGHPPPWPSRLSWSIPLHVANLIYIQKGSRRKLRRHQNDTFRETEKNAKLTCLRGWRRRNNIRTENAIGHSITVFNCQQHRERTCLGRDIPRRHTGTHTRVYVHVHVHCVYAAVCSSHELNFQASRKRPVVAAASASRALRQQQQQQQPAESLLSPAATVRGVYVQRKFSSSGSGSLRRELLARTPA
jgi:hypothetical protein